MRWFCIFIILFLYSPLCLARFQLEPGDLLFQDLDCGELCQGIKNVTAGYGNTSVSHVGMVTSVSGSEIVVIEAISPVVHLVTLKQFLARSHDEEGRPRVMVGRLSYPSRLLIPMATVMAYSMLGRPYNMNFHPNWTSQYCSQLLTVAFKWANHGMPIFPELPMNFRAPHSSVTSPAWEEYFQSIGRPVTQDLMGTNPAAMSNSPYVKIVYHYGELTLAKF
jgi:uncharacterized protein YycO